MPPSDLWFGTSGPPDAPLVLVGEAWGEAEAAHKRPFIGTSGTELNRILAEAGLERDSILCTNVASVRPLGNEMWRLFHPKEAPSGRPLIGRLDPTPLIRDEVARLYQQIAAFPRKLVIAAGNYPLWALSDCAGDVLQRQSNGRLVPKAEQTRAPNGIMNWRGSMWFTLRDRFAPSPSYTETRLLPIVHPAAIMRQWENRQVTVHDLKARVRMALRDDWRHNPAPVFLAPPNFKECVSRLRMWIARADSGQQIRLAEDIETARGLITCIGLADSVHFAMSIPFIRVLDDRSFESWWSLDQESEILGLLHKINSHRNILIEGQNFIYDTQYIQHWMASTPRLDWDSMLAQNVLFPGTPKALDYLSSLYCRYHWFWKEDHKEWNLKGRIEDLLIYNCWDCVRTFEVCEAQRAVMEKSGLSEQMRLKMRIHDLCLRMMKRGFAVDRNRRGRVSFELEEASATLERELAFIIPQEMVSPENKTPWFRSDQQTRYLFYDRLGLPIQKDRKTGNPSVGKEARAALKKKNPEFGGLFERLRLYGSIETAHDVVNAGLDSDFRLRCSYNPGGTETHRLSSSQTAMGLGTNLQNLSKGEEDE